MESEFTKASKALDEISNSLYATTKGLANKKNAEQLTGRLNHEIIRFRKRVYKEYLRKHGIDNLRIDRLFDCIFPNNKRQERQINILYFIETNGIQLIQQLLEIMDPF